MSEEAKLLPPLDDRRRFKSLWRELLYARVLAAMAAGALGETLITPLDPPGLVNLVARSFFMALPSAVAKKGWKVLPLTAALTASAALVVYAVEVCFEVDSGLISRGYPVAIFTAVGVAEGLFERSIATTWCGMIGGALSGAVMDEWVNWFQWHPLLEFLPFDRGVLPEASSSAIAYLGVGLSLALGRWVRDIPKRAAARERTP